MMRLGFDESGALIADSESAAMISDDAEASRIFSELRDIVRRMKSGATGRAKNYDALYFINESDDAAALYRRLGDRLVIARENLENRMRQYQTRHMLRESMRREIKATQGLRGLDLVGKLRRVLPW